MLPGDLQESTITVYEDPSDDGVVRKNMDIEEYSMRLKGLLEALLYGKKDEQTRQDEENLLRTFTSFVPKQHLADKTYPNDHLSRIFVDNYSHLAKFTTLYFNLSLSCHVTKFLVKMVYCLQCWEIYHLLQMVPGVDRIFRLTEVEITTTPFGPIVSPPHNFLGFNLRQGFQYPFPFPFYNFSYHTMNPQVSHVKYLRVNFDHYIDIRLKQSPKKPKKKPIKREIEPDRPRHDLRPERQLRTKRPLEQPVPEKRKRRSHWHDYSFHQMSPAEIDADVLSEKLTYADLADDYNTDEAESMLEKESEFVNQTDFARDHFAIVPSAFEKLRRSPSAFEKLRHAITPAPAVKSGPTVHQCHLDDPNTSRPCLKVFHGKNELQRHQEFVHAKTKKIYRCIYCQKNGNKNQCYPRHDSLARHIRRKHGITGHENKVAVNLAKENADRYEDGMLFIGANSRLPLIAQFVNNDEEKPEEKKRKPGRPRLDEHRDQAPPPQQTPQIQQSQTPQIQQSEEPKKTPMAPGSFLDPTKNASPSWRLPPPERDHDEKTERSRPPQPPAFITSAPMPSSLQYMGQGARKEDSFYPDRHQHPPPEQHVSYPMPYGGYGSKLPPPSAIVSPQVGKSPMNAEADMQSYRMPQGYFLPPAYGQPVYGADGRLYVQVPQMQGAPMGYMPHFPYMGYQYDASQMDQMRSRSPRSSGSPR